MPDQEHETPVGIEGSAGAGPRAARKSAAREWLEALAVAVLLALFIRTFVIQAFKIPSGSMLPTLVVGDHILVSKFVYGIRIPAIDVWLLGPWLPERGDIIVFKYPHDESRDFIKRVIGLPGEVVEVRARQVYINGQGLGEGYLPNTSPSGQASLHAPGDFYGPVTVPAGMLFVLGDNRDHSQDSRFWGFLDMRKVEGEAFVIYWSWDSSERRLRWNRIGKVIH